MKQQQLKIKRKTLFVFKAKNLCKNRFSTDPTTSMMTTTGTHTFVK